MEYELFTTENFKTTTWSGGTTTELYLEPAGRSYAERDFTFRLSSATVDDEVSTFTALPGVRRVITPLDSPLEIKHGSEAGITLQPFELYHFDGGVKTTSRGKTRDFNVMYREGQSVSARVLTKGTKLTLPAGKERYFIFSYRGNQLRLGGDVIAAPTFSLTKFKNNNEAITLHLDEGEPVILVSLSA